MSKQTAVEWLQEALSLTFEQVMQFEGLFQQAKEMEGWQIKEAYNDGAFDTFAKAYKGMHEYYNENYGGNND